VRSSQGMGLSINSCQLFCQLQAMIQCGCGARGLLAVNGASSASFRALAGNLAVFSLLLQFSCLQ
jgi:hypothetical protein